jgi:hypothetical protein
VSSSEPPPFDPWRILGTLERHNVGYVLIGALAGVLHGTDEVTSGVDICPQMKPANLQRLGQALDELEARMPRRRTPGVDVDRLAGEPVTRLESDAGVIKIVPTPAGTRGYDDLRRGASREALGQGVRASVSSVDDLARIMSSRARDGDAERLAGLRRLAELERGIGREL